MFKKIYQITIPIVEMKLNLMLFQNFPNKEMIMIVFRWQFKFHQEYLMKIQKLNQDWWNSAQKMYQQDF